MLKDRNIDLLGLVETRLKPAIHVVENRFPGYAIYRHDRVLRGDGSVALLCKLGFLVELVAYSSELFFAFRSDINCEFRMFSVTPPPPIAYRFLSLLRTVLPHLPTKAFSLILFLSILAWRVAQLLWVILPITLKIPSLMVICFLMP